MSVEQDISDRQYSEEDEAADLIYARGEKSVEDGGRSKDEAEHRSRDSERRAHGQCGHF